LSTIRIGLLGGPSSGKSTLAAWLYSRLKEDAVNTELVQEFAREYINKTGGPKNTLIQFLIYKRQKEKEDILPASVKVMITDSPTILSYIFGVVYGNIKDQDHRHMITEMYNEIIHDGLSRYDLLYYLEPTRPYVEDGTRKEGAEKAREVGNNIKNFLLFHQTSFKILTNPSTEFRANQIITDVKLLLGASTPK